MVLTTQLAENKKSLAHLEELGRSRLEALSKDNLDLITEGSGRAVTPDCPQVPRGSVNTVAAHDCENDIHEERRLDNTSNLYAREADFLIGLFAEAFTS
jgi:hypothetical protein